jgi:hypothetical protein
MAQLALLRAVLRDGARFWLSALVLVSCVASAYAKASVTDGADAPRSRTLHWGAAAASGALLAQLMLGPGENEDTDEQGEVNTSSDLVWREDEGASKLVPLYPGKLALAVRGRPPPAQMQAPAPCKVAAARPPAGVLIRARAPCCDWGRGETRPPPRWGARRCPPHPFCFF